MADPHPLSGSSVLLAGATGGLGRALAEELDARGARLTLAGRRADALDALPFPGARVVADLRDPTACRHLVDAAVAHAGRLDVVINAVGVVAFGALTDMPADAAVDVMEELFLTNTFASIALTRAAIDAMTDGGVIVTMSGVIAERNLPGMAYYGASKAAVHAFAEAAGRELRRRKIRMLDARPPHTESGLASHPIAGTAPRMPVGLSPAHVARVICDAIESGADDLPSTAF